MIFMLVLCTNYYTVRPLLITAFSLLYVLILSLNWTDNWLRTLRHWLTNGQHWSTNISQHSLFHVSLYMHWTKPTGPTCPLLRLCSCYLHATLREFPHDLVEWPQALENLWNTVEVWESACFDWRSELRFMQSRWPSHPMYISHDRILIFTPASNFRKKSIPIYFFI
jgi:hypothetical protein